MYQSFEVQPASYLHPGDVAAAHVGGELISSAVQSLEAAGVDFTPRGSAQEKVQGDATKARGSELWSSGTSKLEVKSQICFAGLAWTVLLFFQSCFLLDDVSPGFLCWKSRQQVPPPVATFSSWGLWSLIALQWCLVSADDRCPWCCLCCLCNKPPVAAEVPQSSG